MVMFFVWFLRNSPFFISFNCLSLIDFSSFSLPNHLSPTHTQAHTHCISNFSNFFALDISPSNFFFSFCTPTQIQEFSPRAFFLFIYPPFPWRWFSRECHCSTRTRANFQLFERICQITLNFLVIPKLIN